MNIKILQQKLISFIGKNLIYFLFGFGLLALLPYVSTFKLDASTNAGTIYRGIIFGLLALLFLVGLACYRKLPNKKILIACLVYMVTQMVAIFVSPLIKEVEIPTLQSVIGVGMIFSNIISVFIVCYIFKYQSTDHEKLNLISYILLGISVALCLYTYIFQYKEIGMSLRGECGISSPVTSIFTNGEIYGFILLISTISTVILGLNTKRYWLYAFPAFFLVNAFLSKNRLALIAIVIILIALLIHHFIHNLKGNEKKWEITLFVGFAVLLILNLLIFVPAMSFGPFATLGSYIKTIFINDGITIMKDRFATASSLMQSVDYPLGILFGAGEKVQSLILPYSSSGNIIYVTNYAVGGIVKFALYLGFIAFVIYKVIKRKGEHLFFSLLFISLIVSIGIFSEVSLLGINVYFLLLAPFILYDPFVKKN
ncbi:MAG: hypothetical protein MJ227_02255 [Bacilli bacterium]|nr:hypothetical protein [Bacilli bacterium]